MSSLPRPSIYFAESVEQDQRAYTCSLILPCTPSVLSLYPPPAQNECFQGHTWISVPVPPSVCASVYKILVILCRKLLQLCFSCIGTLHMHWWYIEFLQDAVLKCQLLLVEELSPLELRVFLNYPWPTKRWRGY